MATNNMLNLGLSGATGTGNFVGSSGATLTAPLLGTPNSGTLTNCTGLPISTGVSGLGTGVATALGSAVVGSGNIVLGSASTWVPVLAFGGGSTGITYTTQSGRFIRNGDEITFGLLITLSNKGSSTGIATVTLPVAVNAASPAPVFAVTGQNITAVLGITALGNAASTTINLYNFVSGSTLTTIQDTAFTNTSWLWISGSYMA